MVVRPGLCLRLGRVVLRGMVVGIILLLLKSLFGLGLGEEVLGAVAVAHWAVPGLGLVHIHQLGELELGLFSLGHWLVVDRSSCQRGRFLLLVEMKSFMRCLESLR